MEEACTDMNGMGRGMLRYERGRITFNDIVWDPRRMEVTVTSNSGAPFVEAAGSSFAMFTVEDADAWVRHIVDGEDDMVLVPGPSLMARNRHFPPP